MNRKARTWIAGLAVAASLGLTTQGTSAEAAAPLAADSAAVKRADFRGESASSDVLHIADWAVHSRDHQGLPFIVVDKVSAKAYAFDRAGKLLRTAPVLVGMGVGDTFAPGVVDMTMHETKPWQRITPAGRFLADEDRNPSGKRILWVDYDTGIALHKVPTRKTPQRRQERIVSPDPAEHRITYGCINVPAVFYDQAVHPYFKGKGGIVYVLPDSTSVKAVFNSYDVGERTEARLQQTAREAVPADVRKF